MRKSTIKQIALQRVSILIDSALYTNDEFAQNHIRIARRIISKYKIKIPFEYKILFCKKCKKYMHPGKDSSIRIGRSNTKALRVTCKFCGHTYRKILKKNTRRSKLKDKTAVTSTALTTAVQATS